MVGKRRSGAVALSERTREGIESEQVTGPGFETVSDFGHLPARRTQGQSQTGEAMGATPEFVSIQSRNWETRV